MPRFFTSNLRGAVAAHKAIAHAAVEGACIAIRNQAKLNVRGGFKSGAFVTGRLFNDISYVIVWKGLVPEGQVGTVIDYGAYWELGHHNVFTRKYERVPWLKPAFVTTAAQQQRNAAILAANEADSRGVRFGGVERG